MAEPDVREAGWIKSIQRGQDRAAAEELVRRYYPEIQRYLVRQLADRDAAADLTQDVFVAALQHIHQFDRHKSGFRTWLYRIATNKLIDLVRTRRRRGVSIDLQSIDPADSFDLAESVATGALAQRALQLLSDQPLKNQEIVRLKLFAEQTFAEISDALGIPEATAKTTYYRALSAVREELSGDHKR